MKRAFVTSILAVIALSLCAAEPKETVSAAAKKLGGQSYSWTTTVQLEGMNFTPGPTTGKTEKDGFTCITQEMNNNTLEAVLKGDKAAVKTEEGWKTAEELTASGAGGQGGFNPARMFARIVQGTKCPAREIEDLLEKAKELKVGDGGLISADLTEKGAAELMTFGRRGRPGGNSPPPPKNASGSVKFWIKDGALAKYEIRVKGTVTFGQDQQEREMGRTSTVELKNVGTTKVEVPEEAKKKISP